MVENNIGIFVSVCVPAEVKYMRKIEFSNSWVNFHWFLSRLLGIMNNAAISLLLISKEFQHISK